MPSSSRNLLCVITGISLAASPALMAAQPAANAAGPCHASACQLVFDWGSGRTAASFGPDRKYGSADDFETALRAALAGRGLRTKESQGDGSFSITLRPTMRARSMCDAMPGTSTDFSCTAMSDLTVTFVSGDSAVKAPGAIRVGNRCGAANVFMTMADFAQYAAGMVWYTLEGAPNKQSRPSGHC